MNTLKGFNNIGNTCYLNSGLQMLIQNMDFCKMILENRDKSENLEKMANFIKEYYTTTSHAITPDKIKEIVGKQNKIFRGNAQQDAGEFIIYLMDILDTDLKKGLNPLFDITTETTIKCKIRKCLRTSVTTHKNPFLILPIKDECSTLDDCYREFKVHEKLEGDEMYYCENCKEKRIASRRLNVIEWSNNLIIWLKRFENNRGRLSKNNKEIEIPIDWRHDFTIKGAVIHGGGINGGHYVYMSRNLSDDTWSMCDDSSVRTIPKEHVQTLLNRAYIFNYVKK
jgi:ubiquitin C-terminal hydrolase